MCEYLPYYECVGCSGAQYIWYIQIIKGEILEVAAAERFCGYTCE